MATIGMRLKEERLRLGLTQPEFAAVADAKTLSQIRYEADERSPDGNYFTAIAEHGADITYILTGVRTISAPAGSPMQMVMKVTEKFGPLFDQIDRRTGVDTCSSPTHQTDDMNADSYAAVPLHEALLAAGAGSQAGEEIIDQLAFRRDWLKRIGLRPAAARLARVTGASMEPTLSEGDMVLIDTSATEPRVVRRDPRDRRRSPIYAIADAGGARIKRIERPEPDQLMLLSDNIDYPPELLHGHDLKELKIIGRVVWWGHTVKE